MRGRREKRKSLEPETERNGVVTEAREELDVTVKLGRLYPTAHDLKLSLSLSLSRSQREKETVAFVLKQSLTERGAGEIAVLPLAFGFLKLWDGT